MTSRAAGTRYARAMFDVVLKENEPGLDQAGTELTAFAGMVAGHELLSRVLSNPGVPAQRKRALIEHLLEASGGVSPILSKLLLVLAGRDRLSLLPEIDAAYRNRLMEHAKAVRAEVVTAVALPADRLAKLREGIARATGRRSEDVQLEHRVDPSLIGGAVTRIGSTVYDGSVVRQLEKMREALAAS